MSMKIRIPEHIMEAVRESARIFHERAMGKGWIKWTIEDAQSHFKHWLHPRLWKHFVIACYALHDEPFGHRD